MKYRWILFDADDTLFDYGQAEAQAMNIAFEASGWAFQPDYVELYQQINQRIWRRFERGEITQAELKVRRFEQLFEAAGLVGDAERFSERYLAGLAQGTQLIDGAEPTVRELHGKVGMVIVTNGLKNVQRPRLRDSTLGDYFDGVVISEEIGAAKPAPEIFDVAFAQMGKPDKREVLIVGDSLTSDIRGGSDYGIDTCWFNPHRKPHNGEVTITYEIRRLPEVLKITGLEPTR